VSRQRKGWTRLRGGCAGCWRHDESGWLIFHCGHPTAIWPYYGVPPGVNPEGMAREEMLLQGGFGLGYAFQKLLHAQTAVEGQLKKAKEEAP
jgi:hypothetical protein